MALALTKLKAISPEAYLAQGELAIEKSKYFHKGEDGRRVLTEFKAIADRLRIEAIDMAFASERIYERVVWGMYRTENVSYGERIVRGTCRVERQ